jgi:hypothetical protein
MSILIKGMEMPSGCYTCPIIYSEDGAFDFECPFNSYLHWHNAEDVINYIPDSCLLVAVPTPHGRLIDADELLRHKYGFSQTARVIIKTTDAVIEAEVSE